MNTFPQMTSGAVAQFPFRKESSYRSLVNSASHANEIVSSDADFHMRVWELPLEQLTNEEWQGIEDLFQTTEGRLGTFLFLEPGQNLLSWSEKLSDPIWQKDSGVSVNDGQSDPIGGMGGVQVTSSGGGATISQVLAIPASYRYVASVWARTSGSGAALRVTDTGSGTVEVGFRSDNNWRRYSVGYGVSSASASLAFELVTPSGGALDVFGPQLEAQIAPSTYKRTEQQAGVFPGARFDSDILSDTATGVDRHSGVIRIVWTPSLT